MTWAKYLEEAKRRWVFAEGGEEIAASAFERDVAMFATYQEGANPLAAVVAMEAACARLRKQIESEADVPLEVPFPEMVG